MAGRHPGLHGGRDSLGSDRVDDQRRPPGNVAPPLEDESGPWTGVLCRPGHPAVPNVSPGGSIALEGSNRPVAQRDTSPTESCRRPCVHYAHLSNNCSGDVNGARGAPWCPSATVTDAMTDSDARGPKRMTRTSGIPVGANVRERLRVAQRTETEAITAIQKALGAEADTRARLDQVMLRHQVELSKAALAVQEAQATLVRTSGLERAAALLEVTSKVLRAAVREAKQETSAKPINNHTPDPPSLSGVRNDRRNVGGGRYREGYGSDREGRTT